MLHHVRLFVTLWTVAHQALLSMGFSGRNTGLGCHFVLQGIFLTQGLNPHLLCPESPALKADSLPTEPLEKPFELFNAKQIIYLFFGVTLVFIVDFTIE